MNYVSPPGKKEQRRKGKEIFNFPFFYFNSATLIIKKFYFTILKNASCSIRGINELVNFAFLTGV
jgi:hypothetical protein